MLPLFFPPHPCPVPLLTPLLLLLPPHFLPPHRGRALHEEKSGPISRVVAAETRLEALAASPGGDFLCFPPSSLPVLLLLQNQKKQWPFIPPLHRTRCVPSAPGPLRVAARPVTRPGAGAACLGSAAKGAWARQA